MNAIIEYPISQLVHQRRILLYASGLPYTEMWNLSEKIKESFLDGKKISCD